MAISNNTTGVRPGVCTSTTRPTAPYEGQQIYETDTDKLLVWNGSTWLYLSTPQATEIGAWQAYTPTIGNVTIGNGTLNFSYIQINKLVHYKGRFTLGSTSAVVSVPQISLPITAIANHPACAVVTFQDTGAATLPASSIMGTTNILLYAVNVGGTYPFVVAPSATVPFTWANTDFIEISMVYEAA